MRRTWSRTWARSLAPVLRTSSLNSPETPRKTRTSSVNLVWAFTAPLWLPTRVEVVSRKAGEERAWRWLSDGANGFEIEPAERSVPGTTVLLHLNEEGKQYANSWRLQEIVKKYSNHIPFPIFLTYDKSEWNETEKKSVKSRTTEQVNAASALWRRNKSELKEEDYKEFYKSITGDWEDPLFWFHTKAEGSLEYTTLFYVASKAPLDLYQADYKTGVKLYVKRVFIMDDAQGAPAGVPALCAGNY